MGDDRLMATAGGGESRGPSSGEGGRFVVPIRPGGGPGRGRWLVVLAGFLLVVAVIVLQRRVGGAPAASPSVDTSDRASPSSSSRSARIDAPPASAPSTAAPSTVTVTEQQQGGIEDP